jgi:putative component of membrane protein insertase Oxa1/YidC/SpoIIIJ protein YidD
VTEVFGSSIADHARQSGAVGLMLACLLAGRVGVAEPAALLASELFAESNWPACRVECARVLKAAPDCYDARLLNALADARLGVDGGAALLKLADDPNAPTAIAGAARYEWARMMWRAGDWQSAFDGFRRVFETTDLTDLAARAGCSLALLMDHHAELARAHPELIAQVQTMRALYSPEIIQECRMVPKAAGGSWLGLPGQWFIAFYRSQIRPALGDRCSLVPNCSEYSRQAFQKYGILGLAITADRFFREPTVVAAGEHPVNVNGKSYCADPLSDHDWWLGD